MPADVSVIIAAYNVETYIERAIRSALDQQDVTVEIIVVNDASTDNTAAVVARINDARVKYIDLAVNGGPSVARNTGIAAATAPWIAVLDGDDAFLPDRIMRCLTRAKAVKADIVVDNLSVYREADGAEYPMYHPAAFSRIGMLDLAHFINGNRSFLGNGEALGYLKPVFSTEFLRRYSLRYDPDLRIGEDYLFLCEALANGARCVVEPVAGYIYTVRKGSISHRLTPADVTRMVEGDKKFLARYSLVPAAARAQARREYGLKEAYAFTKLLDALKQRNASATFKAIALCPPAVRHLWRAVWVRVKNCFAGLYPSAGRIMRSAAQDLLNRKTVLLFYKEFETDSYFKHDRYLKRILRPLYHMTHRRQKKTGFAVSFDLMRRGLMKAGYNVHVNDYRTARNNPDYPVGIVGFPVILENWKLPNPAVLGPSLYDHPLFAPDLLEDPRFKKFAALAPWTLDMFKPVYGEACFAWFAGIDLDEWPDLSDLPKTFDFLIYDKIRWDHDDYEKSLIEPILRILDGKKLTHRLVRYRMHDHEAFQELLKGARGMIFLCEHETQGLAYQEALASGTPILAWDRGFWGDPRWKKFAPTPPPASSVPFFSSACGETFRDMGELESKLDDFMSKRSSYKPRGYVAANLNMEKSAKLYADQYFGLIHG